MIFSETLSKSYVRKERHMWLLSFESFSPSTRCLSFLPYLKMNIFQLNLLLSKAS